MRWLYHLARGDLEAGDYSPVSLAHEGFVHCSYLQDVAESARLYFAGADDVRVFCIDPRRLPARTEVAATPRGPMPHVFGPIPRDAIRDVIDLSRLHEKSDEVTGTRFAFVSFPGVTLLDLVGAYDPISRIRAMGFDPTASCEIVGGVAQDDWRGDGARLLVERVRPELDGFDVLVIPGGPGSRALEGDTGFLQWLGGFPANRLTVSICTGSLVLGAAGRLRDKRATTHPSRLSELPGYGATAVSLRVVDEGQLITGGGVTSALDVGLHVVRRLMGPQVADSIAAQMVYSARM